jgi:hypothetical protein
MNSRRIAARLSLSLLVAVSMLAACDDNSTTGTGVLIGDDLALTSVQLHALDSTGQAIEQANPTNATLKSLVDSTLTILSAGVVAKRIDVATDLTTNPLFFVGVHRVFEHPTGASFSTWNIVGMDDPMNLKNVIEVSGFAQANSTTAPSSVTGTVGDGTGIANGFMLQIAPGGSVTQWSAGAGSVSVTTDPGTTACPGFVSTVKVTCTLETVHVHFDIASTGAAGGAGPKHATVASDVVVPMMRLTYTS